MNTKLNKIIFYIIGAVLVIGGVVIAGSLTPSVNTSTPNFVTLSDIYNKLLNNTYSAPTHSLSTTTAPTSTMYTLESVWNVIPNILASNIVSGTTIMGVAGTYNISNITPDKVRSGITYGPNNSLVGTLVIGAPSWTCGNTLTDSRDSKNYSTVSIGSQCWMAENLNYNDGVCSAKVWATSTDNGWCGNNTFPTQGGPFAGEPLLYEWSAAMNNSVSEGAQGLCPTGWHVPTDAEFITLEEGLGMCTGTGTGCSGATGSRGTDQGGQLKATGTTYWLTPNTGATNSTGFNSKAFGTRNASGLQDDHLQKTIFWTSSASGVSAWRRNISYNNSLIVRATTTKSTSVSIRCLKGVASATAPGAPTSVSATPGHLQATVTFSAASNGGSAITGYTVTSSPAGGVDTNAGTTGLSHVVTGLTSGISYTFTVIATNAIGTGAASSPSNSITSVFVCGDSARDADGNSYATVSIGSQCWFAQNLNIGTKVLGASSQIDNNVIEKYCYNDDSSICNTDGGLYQWNEAMQYAVNEGVQGICPTGWHIPADSELSTLEEYLGMCTGTGAGCSGATGGRGTDQGGQLKATGTAYWLTPNTGATNSSGFTAIPSGQRSFPTGAFSSRGSNIFIWSSSSSTSATAWRRSESYNNSTSVRVASNKPIGYSIRCLQGNGSTPVIQSVPGIPTSVSATAGDSSATVTFTAPVSDGGSAITGYNVTSNPATYSFWTESSPIYIAPLDNGTSYTFTVSAQNANGIGSASTPSNSVTPFVAVVPNAPTNVNATAGNTQATITFSAPSNGGSPVTGYTVTSYPAGGVDSSAGMTSLIHIVNSLINDVVYYFTVTATNAVGTSPDSVSSNSVAPVGVPAVSVEWYSADYPNVAPDNAAPVSTNWSTGEAYCSSLSGGWRLPTRSELVAKWNEAQTARAAGFMGYYYWSNTPDPDYPSTSVYIVDMGYGFSSLRSDKSSTGYYVRCVR